MKGGEEQTFAVSSPGSMLLQVDTCNGFTHHTFDKCRVDKVIEVELASNSICELIVISLVARTGG